MSENESSTRAGCGLAAYALVLLGVCVIGVLGIVFSTLNILHTAPDSVSELVHGSEVQVWRLQPMRIAGALELTEVPLAWHDESPMRDGTTVCALRTVGVTRVEDGEAVLIAYDAIKDIEAIESAPTSVEIRITGAESTFGCHFGPREGADGFIRQLSAEQAKHR